MQEGDRVKYRVAYDATAGNYYAAQVRRFQVADPVEKKDNQEKKEQPMPQAPTEKDMKSQQHSATIESIRKGNNGEYGFIVDMHGRKTFFHHTALVPDFGKLSVGQKVLYHVAYDHTKMKYYAVRVWHPTTSTTPKHAEQLPAATQKWAFPPLGPQGNSPFEGSGEDPQHQQASPQQNLPNPFTAHDQHQHHHHHQHHQQKQQQQQGEEQCPSTPRPADNPFQQQMNEMKHKLVESINTTPPLLEKIQSQHQRQATDPNQSMLRQQQLIKDLQGK
eukprot:gene2630-15546_t